ncbi:MAG TPA: OPT/YSL family transporter, partial [Pirellulales bacterium]|nr:OPT/YSL family transporter [Pirellulales bacterium]
VGALTSALVIGWTLLLLNQAGTIYSRQGLPTVTVPNVGQLTQMEQAGSEYAATDPTMYHVLSVTRRDRLAGVLPGKYLIDDAGRFRYYIDPAINGRLKSQDDGRPVTRFAAAKTQLIALIIDGIFNGELPWSLVVIGGLIAVVLELSGVPSLPFAVGVYLPITASVPIFLGGLLRWLVDRWRRSATTETETGPGILLSSGYIAGGTLAGVAAAMMGFLPNAWVETLQLSRFWSQDVWEQRAWPALVTFAVLMLVLLLVGSGKMLGGQKKAE